MKRPSPRCLKVILFSITLATFSILSGSGSSQSVKPEKKIDQNESEKRDGEKRQTPKTGSNKDRSRQLLHTKSPEATATPTPDDDSSGAQSFALLVGISSYKNLSEKAQLQFADKDARAMRDFLISPKGGFRPENVVLLVNEEATLPEILHALEALQNRAGPRDIAFIFFAGHGFVNRSNQGFLLTYDSMPDNLLPTAIEMDRFNSVLKNMRARSTVIFTDACHSGAISDLTGQSDSSEAVRNISAKSFTDPSSRSDQSSFILSAASPTQSSWEIKSLEHGLFTYHALGGLEGKADRNADGLITSKELYDYVATQVQRQAEQEGRHQVPEFNPHYDPSIPLAFLNDVGEKLYRDWFESDPYITRFLALFEDALKDNRLTRPERDNAWDYYNILKYNPRTPMERVKQLEEILLAKLETSAHSVIVESPKDPGLWQEASSWLEIASKLSADKLLRPKQAYCSAMAAHYVGENGRAERECDAAMNMLEEGNLKEPILYLRLAQFYRKQERWAKAHRGYKIAIEEDPKVDWIGEYAEVLIQLNDLSEAEAQLRRAKNLNPDYTQGLKLLAEVLLRSDDKSKHAEAVEIAEQARKIKPEDIEIESVYGWALLKAGMPARATGPLRKVAQLRLSDNVRRDTALLRLSQAYAENGDLNRSISALQEAEQRGSRSVAIFDGLSQRLEERGDLEGAIQAAEKAVNLTENNAQEKAKRLHRVAELLERTGNLSQAALKYRDAARLSADIKVNTLLDAHARVLSYRAGRPQDVGPLPNRSVSQRRRIFDTGELLIVPGGREALERLTGVRIEASAEGNALATIFEACLQDPAVQSRLIYFYEKYPALDKKLQNKGVRPNERFELPASNEPMSEAAKEALAFFGIKEKNGNREINKKEFEAKKVILEALGGDAERLERGESTFIVFKTNDFSLPLGMQKWSRWIKNGAGTRPQDLMLAFLRDPQTMRLFVGLSVLPEEAAEWMVVRALFRENLKDFPAGIYFAAPYLRFTSEGHLYIPGQRQGEINWQRALKVNTFDAALQALFRRENGRTLYLFAALSSAGEVGDLIASSPLFDRFFGLLKESPPPSAREPFDLIDLLSLLRVDDSRLRLPNAVELWLGAGQKEIDPAMAMIARIEKLPVGRQIPFVRQAAVLNHIERLRFDWVNDSDRVALIAKQVIANREPQLEVALDLNMDWKQIEDLFAHIARIESISTPSVKNSTIRAFQSVFGVLRLAAGRGLDQAKINEATNTLLGLDAGSEGYIFDLVSALKGLIGAEPSMNAQEVEARLVSLLSGDVKYDIPKKNDQTTVASNNVERILLYRFDGSRLKRDETARALEFFNHTRFKAVIAAISALDVLASSPSDERSLEQLKSAIGEFVEPDPPPLPKKGSKQPVVVPPTIKEVASKLAAPVAADTITDLRNQIIPYVGEALLGMLYAATIYQVSEESKVYSELVRKHDITGDAWGDAAFDKATKTVRGNIARLGPVLAEIQAGLAYKSAQSGRLSELFTTVVLNSFDLVEQRFVTNRAQEYVVRSIDLGEDVLGLYLLGDQAAKATINELDRLLSLRRAHAVRSWLDQAEINKAIGSLSVSELYAIGQRYLKTRMAGDSLSELSKEPGSLGAIARLLVKAQSNDQAQIMPHELEREIRQFGVTTVLRSNLARLDLRELESYERAMSVEDIRRLVERMQDFKLVIARASYQQGYPASASLSPVLARSILQQTLARLSESTGRIPPDRDWQDFLSVIQAHDKNRLAAFVEQLAQSGYISLLPEAKWDDVKESVSVGARPDR